jgi:uncharacterized protein YijF (DUF1287 family)
MKNLIQLAIILLILACKPLVANINSKSEIEKEITNYSNEETAKMMENLEYQLQHTKFYDPSYQSIKYPNGDVSITTGVCADVVIRALRAISIDLQKEIHEDMVSNFSKYPNNWGLTKTDKNIDHRRVLNILTYLKNKGKSSNLSSKASDYLPGDIVCWKLENNLYHIGIVYNKIGQNNIPLVVHNIGSGAKCENVLFEWDIIGHFRI